MNPYGSDRVRSSAGKFILHSRLPKGWVARTPRTNTSAEFPGTAVLWDDEYFEVVSAEALPVGGVRYVLDKWPDDHAIRVFAAYSEESEARLLEDHEKAATQRRTSVLARLSGVLLGHLPAPVQMHLGNELGLFPARMTLLSIIPFVVLLGVCIFFGVDSRMSGKLSPIPTWVSFFALFMTAEGGVRFLVVMLQNRGMGSALGTTAYAGFWLVMRNRMKLIAPFEGAKGEKVFMIPPSEEQAQFDSVEWRSWMLTLLSPREQQMLAERHGYDYRKHAYELAGALLAVGAIGVLASVEKLARPSGLVSLVVAAFIMLEQILRLFAFKRGPAGSVFGVLVRPFVRDLLKSAES